MFWTSKSAKPFGCYELAKWGGHKWSKKKWPFLPLLVSKRAWNGQKTCQRRGFRCKKSWGIHWSWFQSTKSSHFARNWWFMQITLRTAHLKTAHYHTLTPLNPQKIWFEAPKFLLNDCLPLASNTTYPPPFFFLLLAAFWPLVLGGKATFLWPGKGQIWPQ